MWLGHKIQRNQLLEEFVCLQAGGLREGGHLSVDLKESNCARYRCKGHEVQIGELEVTVLVKVEKFKEKPYLVLNSTISKEYQYSKELDAVYHTICKLIPHREYSLVNSKNLLKFT